MCTPYGPNVLDNCLTCPVRAAFLFCNLSVDAVRHLNDIRATAVYPKRAMLFMEGQQPRGVFVLCSGQAKLSTSSFEGKTVITKVSRSGDVLGLNAVVSSRPYEVTAEMTELGQANFIARDSLLQFQKEHREVALRVAEELSRNCYTAHEEIRISASRIHHRENSRCFCFPGGSRPRRTTVRPRLTSRLPTRRLRR